METIGLNNVVCMKPANSPLVAESEMALKDKCFERGGESGLGLYNGIL